MTERITAGTINNKLLYDTTKFNAEEVGQAMCEDIGKHFRECIDKHKPIIDEKEFCVVMVIANDPLIPTMRRRKFYAWPYLPSPRPNQSVFLYNRDADDLIKRLWVLPNDMLMAELCSLSHVNKKYFTMKKWSEAFFHGWVHRPILGSEKSEWINTTPSHFFNVIRCQHEINMPSEHEYILSNRDKLMKAGCKVPAPNLTDPFDFSKIHIKNFVDTNEPRLDQCILDSNRKA